MPIPVRQSRKALILIPALALLVGAFPAAAQSPAPAATDLMPAQVDIQYGGEASAAPADPAGSHLINDAPTHPQLSMTPDKTELITLDRDAALVIVGNPLHLSVIADSKRVIMLVPRQPGATFLRVLDKDNNVIMQRHVVIVAPSENYVRIRRSCAGANTPGCAPTTVFYCPDMCHQVDLVQTDPATASSAVSLPVANTPDLNDEDVVGNRDAQNEDAEEPVAQDIDDDDENEAGDDE